MEVETDHFKLTRFLKGGPKAAESPVEPGGCAAFVANKLKAQEHEEIRNFEDLGWKESSPVPVDIPGKAQMGGNTPRLTPS